MLVQLVKVPLVTLAGELTVMVATNAMTAAIADAVLQSLVVLFGEPDVCTGDLPRERTDRSGLLPPWRTAVSRVALARSPIERIPAGTIPATPVSCSHPSSDARTAVRVGAALLLCL